MVTRRAVDDMSCARRRTSRAIAPEALAAKHRRRNWMTTASNTVRLLPRDGATSHERPQT
jgi:hypothetical protein